MAGALDGIIKSLVKQGTGKADGPVLPHWIRPGASLLYESQTAGKALPAVVDNISYDKKMVFLKFPHAKGGKALPFAQILSKNNPLQRGASDIGTAKADAEAKEGGDKEADGDEAENFLADMDKKWADSAAAKEAAPAPMQGPAPMPDWARRMGKEKVEDLTSDRVHDIDSSPEPEVSKKKQKMKEPEDIDNPYALSAEVSAAVAKEKQEAAARARNARPASRSRSCSRHTPSCSPEAAKDSRNGKTKERKASPRKQQREARSPARDPPAKKRRKEVSRSPSAEPPVKKRRKVSRSPSDPPPSKRRKVSRSRSAELRKKRRKPSRSPSPKEPPRKRRQVSRSRSPQRRKSSRSARRRR